MPFFKDLRTIYIYLSNLVGSTYRINQFMRLMRIFFSLYMHSKSLYLPFFIGFYKINFWHKVSRKFYFNMYSYRWLSRQTKRANVLLDPSRNEKEALCSEGTFLLVAGCKVWCPHPWWHCVWCSHVWCSCVLEFLSVVHWDVSVF